MRWSQALQACMSASCTQSGLMCGMHAFCARHQHTHVVSATKFCVLAYFFRVSLSLSLVSSPSLSHPLSLCNCQYFLSLSQSLSTFSFLLFIFFSYLFSLFPLLVSPVSLSLISRFSSRRSRLLWCFLDFSCFLNACMVAR